MIDTLSLALSHGLLFLAAVMLLRRDDLDKDPDAKEPGRVRRAHRRDPGA